MRSLLRRRPSPALIVAMLALLVALGGTATGLPGKGRIDKNDLRKRVVGPIHVKKNAVKPFQLAPNAVRPFHLQRDYVQESELLWALIDGDTGAATVVRGRGVVDASSPGTGRYLVTFDRDITTCGLQATLADATSGAGSDGEITFDLPVGNSVEVNTSDSAGDPENTLATDGFYIQAVC